MAKYTVITLQPVSTYKTSKCSEHREATDPHSHIMQAETNQADFFMPIRIKAAKQCFHTQVAVKSCRKQNAACL